MNPTQERTVNLPKKCSDCRFYCGSVVEDSTPYKVSLGCNILLHLGEYVPAKIAKDEPPLNCPLAMCMRFRTLCEQCFVEDYGAESEFEELSIRLPVFYNKNVGLTLDYLGGRLGKHPAIEAWLENKALFGRKPDTGDWCEVNLRTGEVVNARHQHNLIKDVEARMALAKKPKTKVEPKYELQVHQSLSPRRAEIWKEGSIVQWFDLKGDRNEIYCGGDGDLFAVGEGQPLVTAVSARLLFDVVSRDGKIIRYIDYQEGFRPMLVPELKPTTEERLDTIEKHLGLK